MIVKEPHLVRALDAPGTNWRIVLLHGADDGGNRTHVERLAAAMGPDAVRVDLDGKTLADDPARLPDEANAMTMFGGPRWIRVTGGEETAAAVAALLDAPVGCPVIIVAGALKPASALLKRLAAEPDALVCISYRVEGAKAEAMATRLARGYGLRLSSDAASLIAEASAGDRALMQRELEKLALFLDAAPDRPRPASRQDVEAIGAAVEVREPWALVEAVFEGQSGITAGALSGEGAGEPIPAIRALQRRALTISRAIAASRGSAGARLFGRDRDAVERQSRHWTGPGLASAHARLFAAEAALKRTGSAGNMLAEHEILAVARAAERRR